MRVLGQICTFNDDAVIDRSLGALLAQTRPLDGILIVDNGSSDDTLNREFPPGVEVVRHGQNLGTSGGAYTAIHHALDHGYDWVWIIDGDSAARPDALEKLLGLYERLSAPERDRVLALSALAVDVATQGPQHGALFTETGRRMIDPDPALEFYECHSTIWSGTMFRCEAARMVGLPNPDYVLDWGEIEYAFRGWQHGYTIIVHQGAILDHNIGIPGGRVGPPERTIHVGPLRYRLPLLPPVRIYYVYRNSIYFSLHEYFKGRPLRFLRFSFLPLLRLFVKLLVARGWSPETRASALGAWHGLRGNLRERFETTPAFRAGG